MKSFHRQPSPSSTMRCLALLAALLLLACLSPAIVSAHEGHSSSADPPAEPRAAADQSAPLASSALFPSPAANSDKDTVDKQRAQKKWNSEHGLGEQEGEEERGRTAAAAGAGSGQSDGGAQSVRPADHERSTPITDMSTCDPSLTLPRLMLLLLLRLSLLSTSRPSRRAVRPSGR